MSACDCHHTCSFDGTIGNEASFDGAIGGQPAAFEGVIAFCELPETPSDLLLLQSGGYLLTQDGSPFAL